MKKIILKRPPHTSTLRGNFVSDWEYDRTIERAGIPLHLWQCKHREGYTAYALTNQPDGTSVGHALPSGTSHFVDRAGLRGATGIDLPDTDANTERCTAMHA